MRATGLIFVVAFGFEGLHVDGWAGGGWAAGSAHLARLGVDVKEARAPWYTIVVYYTIL